jgi:eukaryotic translation initiation factor 2-alpha kinase 4
MWLKLNGPHLPGTITLETNRCEGAAPQDLNPLLTSLISIYTDSLQVVTAAQDWIASNITPPVEVVGSLASEMIKRASEEEQVSGWLGLRLLAPRITYMHQAKKRREEAEAQEEAERKRLFAEAVNEQIQANVHRHRIERERHRARHRAQSDATQVPELADDILTQSFDCEIIVNELRFRAVKLFHPRHGQLSINDIACNPVT